jgi:hypothetical protein
MIQRKRMYLRGSAVQKLLKIQAVFIREFFNRRAAENGVFSQRKMYFPKDEREQKEM